MTSNYLFLEEIEKQQIMLRITCVIIIALHEEHKNGNLCFSHDKPQTKIYKNQNYY